LILVLACVDKKSMNIALIQTVMDMDRPDKGSNFYEIGPGPCNHNPFR
jgi:hypothetical protein